MRSVVGCYIPPFRPRYIQSDCEMSHYVKTIDYYYCHCGRPAGSHKGWDSRTMCIGCTDAIAAAVFETRSGAKTCAFLPVFTTRLSPLPPARIAQAGLCTQSDVAYSPCIRCVTGDRILCCGDRAGATPRPTVKAWRRFFEASEIELLVRIWGQGKTGDLGRSGACSTHVVGLTQSRACAVALWQQPPVRAVGCSNRAVCEFVLTGYDSESGLLLSRREGRRRGLLLGAS